MGINVNGLRFLLHAKAYGVDFSKTAMIGRQGLYLPFKKFRGILNTEFGYNISTTDLHKMYDPGFADGLLEFLGAKEIYSFDYSEYEDSTYSHDFNNSIPAEFHNQYTVVIEGGTLEHVFNFPTGIKNCMQMISTNGHYLGISPSNNYMGHGFYQLCPELYFRALSEENGFKLDHILMPANKKGSRWYSIADPDTVRSRVGIKNSISTLLFILAYKVEDKPVFSTPPLQSYYTAAWDEHNTGIKSAKLTSSFMKSIRRFMGPGFNSTFFQSFKLHK